MAPHGRFPLLLSAALCVAAPLALADHREAEFVAENPKIDGTDLFVFRSYEEGREDFVTLIACYQPYQEPAVGPFCYTMDPDAFYDVHVDRDGDARADLTFRFRFTETMSPGYEDVGNPGAERRVARPLLSTDPLPVGGVRATEMAIHETYTVDVIDHDAGTTQRLNKKGKPSIKTFEKAGDYFGTRSFPDYETYADAHVFEATFPGGWQGRVFVGPREDPLVFNMGEMFDLVNLDLTGRPDAERDALADLNVTALALEVPVPVLGAAGRTLGVWTTASLPATRQFTRFPAFDGVDVELGEPVQVSRVGSPLVSSMIIGLDHKEQFNRFAPTADGAFLDFFTHPAMPEMIEDLTGLGAPDVFPRGDLFDWYLRGLEGLNRTRVRGEMLRFTYDFEPTPAALQSNLGALGGDLAGYPNGRRPGDDVVDITLRVLMGANLETCASPEDGDPAPSGKLPLTDGAHVDAASFDATWPYLRTPVPGSPNE